MNNLSLVVVSAGVTTPSSTRLLADRVGSATLRTLEPAGPVDLTVIELADLAGDIARAMVGGVPTPALTAASNAVTSANGLIAATPIFTASYSGLFKSFIDILDKDALTGTPVVLAATGGTERHALALKHALRPLFAYLRAVVVPTAVFAAPSDWGGGDPLVASLSDRIGRAGRELAAQMIPEVMAPTVAIPHGHREALGSVVPFEQHLEALARYPAAMSENTGATSK